MIKNREKKKEALKSRIIKFDETAFVEQNNKKPIKNKKKKVAIVIIILSIIFLVLLFLIITRKYTHTMTLFTKTLSDTNSKEAKNNVNYISYKKGIIRYSLDGASYIDKNGSTKWSVAYNLSNPKIEVKGDYAFVADIKGVNGYLFTEFGKIIDITSDSMIDNFSLSNNGDIAILTNGNEESYVYLYDRSGKNGDVYIKYVQKDDGVPLDISLSLDGKLLMVSFCKIENNKISSYINIYNFDVDTHMQNDDRLIKKIDAFYDDKVVAKVDFLDDEKAVAFYDGGLTFLSINKKMINEINENMLINNINEPDNNKYQYNDIIREKNIIKNEIMHSVYVEKDKVYIVLENESEKNKLYMLVKYDKNGNEKLKKNFDKEFITFYVTNGLSVFMGIDDLLMIDNFGIVRYDGRFLDNYVYIKNMLHFGFIDVAVGLENSFKRVLVY